MTERIKRAFCTVTSVVLLVGIFASPVSARETRRFSAWPADIPQGMRTTWRYLDPETLTADVESMMDDLLQEAEKRADAEVLFDRCAAIDQRLETLGTYYSFLNWDYHREPQRYSGDAAAWSAMLYTLQSKWGETLRTLLAMDAGEALYRLLGERDPSLLYTSASLSEEQMQLLDEIQELVTDCDFMLLTLSERGVFSGAGDVTGSYPSVDETFEALGEQYLALVERRNQLAETMGFDNWLSYCYAMEYGREYTPEEAYAYCRRVPAAVNRVYEQIGFLSVQNGFEDVFYSTGQEIGDSTTAAIAPFLEQVSSELKDLLLYAEENRLLDTETLTTKLPGAYTAP